MIRRGKKKKKAWVIIFFSRAKICVLFQGWWGYLISLLLALSARASAHAVLLSKQLHLNFSFSRGCRRRARQDEGHGGLRAAAGATPLRSRETWGAGAGVCHCWQRFSASEEGFLLEVSPGPPCLKNDCLFKICSVGADSALIPELSYPSEDYQKTKMKTKT